MFSKMKNWIKDIWEGRNAADVHETHRKTEEIRKSVLKAALEAELRRLNQLFPPGHEFTFCGTKLKVFRSRIKDDVTPNITIVTCVNVTAEKGVQFIGFPFEDISYLLELVEKEAAEAARPKRKSRKANALPESSTTLPAPDEETL